MRNTIYDVLSNLNFAARICWQENAVFDYCYYNKFASHVSFTVLGRPSPPSYRAIPFTAQQVADVESEAQDLLIERGFTP
jgi:hypothetical protein